MNKRVFKKILSVLACVGMLVAFASISNAYTFGNGVNSGGRLDIYSQNISAAGTYSYSYSITFIQYDGLAVGAHMPGMTIQANSSTTVCTINSTNKSGSYYLPSAGNYTYRVVNNTGRHASIRGSFFG